MPNERDDKGRFSKSAREQELEVSLAKERENRARLEGFRDAVIQGRQPQQSQQQKPWDEMTGDERARVVVSTAAQQAYAPVKAELDTFKKLREVERALGSQYNPDEHEERLTEFMAANPNLSGTQAYRALYGGQDPNPATATDDRQRLGAALGADGSSTPGAYNLETPPEDRQDKPTHEIIYEATRGRGNPAVLHKHLQRITLGAIREHESQKGQLQQALMNLEV